MAEKKSAWKLLIAINLFFWVFLAPINDLLIFITETNFYLYLLYDFEIDYSMLDFIAVTFNEMKHHQKRVLYARLEKIPTYVFEG